MGNFAMMKRILLLVFLLPFIPLDTLAQGKGPHYVRCVIVDDDTIITYTLPDVYVFEPIKFKNPRQKRQYTRLVYNVKRVYPYAKLAGAKFRFYEDTLARIKDERAQKAMMKKVEDEIMAEFGDELKKLTFTQGTILIKLIDRETGNTSYDILKDFRGRLIATLWQTLGRLFGYDLKERYDPRGKDWQIEYIVKQIEAGAI